MSGAPFLWKSVDRVANFVSGIQVFSANECLDIIEEAKNYSEFKKGAIGGAKEKTKEPGVDLKVRDSDIIFFHPTQKTQWIFEKLSHSINEVNNQYFNFDLDGLIEGIQFTKYEAPGQHYDWHIDKGNFGPTRKLSLTIQLSDPEEYEGGDLEVNIGVRNTISCEKTQGCATFFPSYILHKVTPVTKGTRYSLVAWVYGPNFK
jgi:PKHD-type hydroxylase